ncbi:MAG: ABC transporter permease, partial [Acidobacteria bacterium]|nr:ABC transporter permease [Acidobacteriota bacterium]
MGTIWQDLRYGFRMLLKNPGFTAIAVLAVALGIGANATIFSTVNALLLRPFSFANQARLMMIWERLPEVGMRRGAVAPGNYADWREQNRVFEQSVAFHNNYFNLTEGDQPERIAGARVGTNFFDLLGVRATKGRTFSAEEGESGKDQVAVVRQSLWQRRFNSDPELVGKTLALDSKRYTVVGIVSQDFNFPNNNTELWTPLAFDPKEKGERDSHYLQVIGLLKPGVTREQAQSDLDAISLRQQQQFPETNSGRTAFVETLNESYTRGPRPYLIILMGAVVFVLLLA